jgi:hypothetical protein
MVFQFLDEKYKDVVVFEFFSFLFLVFDYASTRFDFNIYYNYKKDGGIMVI